MTCNCDFPPCRCLECVACLWRVKTWAPERFTAAIGNSEAQAVLVDEWLEAGAP